MVAHVARGLTAIQDRSGGSGVHQAGGGRSDVGRIVAGFGSVLAEPADSSADRRIYNPVTQATGTSPLRATASLPRAVAVDARTVRPPSTTLRISPEEHVPVRGQPHPGSTGGKTPRPSRDRRTEPARTAEHQAPSSRTGPNQQGKGGSSTGVGLGPHERGRRILYRGRSEPNSSGYL